MINPDQTEKQTTTVTCPHCDTEFDTEIRINIKYPQYDDVEIEIEEV